MTPRHLSVCRALTLLALFAVSAATQDVPLFEAPPQALAYENDAGRVIAVDAEGALAFDTWNAYFASDFFARHGMHCGQRPLLPVPGAADGSTADCSSGFTNPASEYNPSGATYDIPVVVHVLQHPNGNGFVSDALIHSQIDVLNEDFRALGGSLGSGGTDARIQFHLATVDPSGNPTDGITRHTSSQWYNDSGNYAGAVGWDTSRYLNIYTNTAGGNLGYAYVPSGGGVVGTSFDGVRIYWAAFGRNAPIGHPYNLGRTATHEVGHYLGLYHTFQGGCASASGCASNGDLICDTNPEGSPTPSGTCSKATCGSSDPTDNYMDYSDDICMQRFTAIQANRMRCTVQNFRAALLSEPPEPNTAPSVTITSPSGNLTVDAGTAVTFSGNASDAEDGNLSSSIGWSSNLDGSLGSGSSVTATLSTGTHTVTASVVDAGGAGANDQVTVTVQSVGGGGVQLSANGYKVKGKHHIDLTWSGASGGSVDVFRNGSFLLSTSNDGAYTDATGNNGGANYTYQVCESGGGACSDPVTVVF